MLIKHIKLQNTKPLYTKDFILKSGMVFTYNTIKKVTMYKWLNGVECHPYKTNYVHDIKASSERVCSLVVCRNLSGTSGPKVRLPTGVNFNRPGLKNTLTT